MQTAKQWAPEVGFKHAYMATYRRLRDMQLTRRRGKTQAASSCLKSA